MRLDEMKNDAVLLKMFGDKTAADKARTTSKPAPLQNQANASLARISRLRPVY